MSAIIVGELYRYQGEWKFSAVGSGFYGGLEALVTHYGLELEEAGDRLLGEFPCWLLAAKEKRIVG